MHDHPGQLGLDLKFAGIDAVISADQAPHRNHYVVFSAVLDTLIASGREFTADDVWRHIDPDTRLRAPINLLPALFATAATAGRITPVAFDTSNRPSRHGGVFRRWRGADAAT